jgi:CheY-like chemotaxis protein
MATILLVDDCQSILRLLELLLSNAGHQTIQAIDGAEGLAQARAQRPDLIITDVKMPRMDGIEFIRRIQCEPEISDTPVIFYSGTFVASVVSESAKGFENFVVLDKPAAPHVLVDTVNRLLNHAA